MKHSLFLYFLLSLIHTGSAFCFDSKNLVEEYRKKKESGCGDSLCIENIFKLIYEADYYDPRLSDSLSLDFLKFSESGSDYARGKARLIRGSVLSFRGENSRAIEYLLEALKFLGEGKPSVDVCFTYQMLAKTFKNTSNFRLAMKYAKMGLVMARELKNKTLINNSVNFIGVLYNNDEKYGEAIKAFKYLAKINKDEKEASDFKKALINLAVSYRKLNMPDSSVYYAHKALSLAEETEDWYNESFALHELGAAYLLRGKNDSAIYYLEKAIKIREEKNESYEIIWSHLMLSDALMKTDKVQAALGHLRSALYQNEKSGRNEGQLVDIYERMGAFFNKIGKNDSAYFYSVKRSQIQENMLRRKIEASADALIASYEFDEKEKEIRLLNSLKIQKELKIKQQRIYNILAILGIITLIVVISLILVSRNRQMKNLKLQNRLKEEQLKNFAVQTINEEKTRISRDLHDNVGAYLSYLTFGIEKLLTTDAGSLSKETLSGELENLKEYSAGAMMTLRETIWAINKEELSLEDLADRFKKYILRQKEKRTEMKFVFSESFEKNIALNPNLALNLFRICQEAFNNAIKHSGADTVEVSFEFADERLGISVKDNGKGFAPSPTKDDHYGLKNMTARAEELGAQFSIKSSPGSGTQVTVELILKPIQE